MKTELKILEQVNTEVFEIFAKLHPIEAFDLDKKRFIKYVRKQGYKLTEKEIVKLVNESRNGTKNP